MFHKMALELRLKVYRKIPRNRWKGLWLNLRNGRSSAGEMCLAN